MSITFVHKQMKGDKLLRNEYLAQAKNLKTT